MYQNIIFRREKIKSIDKFRIVILTMILFSGATFYSSQHYKYYIGIIAITSLYVYIYILGNFEQLFRVLKSKFTLWLIVVFSIYIFYGLALPKYNYFNVDYICFIMLIIFNIILLFYGLDRNRLISILIKSCFISTILICAFIFINEKELIMTGGTRIGESGSGNVTVISAYLGVLSIPCIYNYLYKNELKYLYIYIVQVIFMLLTGSKKSLIFIVIGIGLLVILKYKMNIHKYIVPILLGMFFLFIIFNNDYFYNIIGYRIIDFLSGIGFDIEGARYSRSTYKRINMMKSGLEAFYQNPIFGGGWFYFSKYTGMGTYSHNNFIEILVTYGLFGFFIYYSMYIIIIKKLLKLIFKSNTSKLFFVLNVTILLADNTGVTFSQYPLNYIILLFTWIYLNDKLKINIK